MPLHFLDDEAATAQPGESLTLTGAEAHHAATVRRLRVGEAVTVGDGRGVWLTGTCAAVGPREVVVRIATRRDEPEAAPRLVLAQALAKGDRDELAVQAATELGVSAIVPWQAGRSVSRWDAAKAAKGRARWETIAREAAKQAHRAWVPEVTELVTTAALAERAASTQMLVLDPEASAGLTGIRPDGRDLVFVVGPEGGIAPDELELLESAGAVRVRLGATVLRTSTAGPAALAIANALLRRW